MNSNWGTEVFAVYRKEAISELRAKSGLATAGLFGVVAVFTIAFATMNSRLDGNIAAGLVWVAILFSSVIALPRTFLVEEEQGTGDLLRLMARPHAVFWGKALFNLTQMIIIASVLSFLYLGFTGLSLKMPWLFVASLIAGCAALAGAVTLSGAIVARAANRAALAGAVAVPSLLPIMAMGVSGMRAAFGVGFAESAQYWTVGLAGYAVLTLAIGPWLFAAFWKS